MASAELTRDGDTYVFVDIVNNKGVEYLLIIDLDEDCTEDEIRIYKGAEQDVPFIVVPLGDHQ